MAKKGERLVVQLDGGAPWGFRLQGGSGTGQRLAVSKIRRRSRAHNQLREGDVILSINGNSCDNLNYDQAMAIVDTADRHLSIAVLRSPDARETASPMMNGGISSPISWDSRPSTREEVISSEIRRKVTTKQEGFRITSATVRSESETKKDATIQKQQQTTSKQDVTSQSLTSCHQKSLPSVNNDDTYGNVTVANEGSQRQFSKDVTQDQKGYRETVSEYTHDKHGATETTTLRKEERSVVKDVEPVPECVDQPSSFSLLRLEDRTPTPHAESTTSSTSMFKVTKFETKGQSVGSGIWKPEVEATIPTCMQNGTVTTHETTSCSSFTSSPVPTSPAPTPPRPDSAAEMADENRARDSMTTEDPLNPNFYVPSPDFPDDLSMFTRRKKMFSSSSFYEEPNCIYPTVEEQVELCRKIADSLSSDTNKKSRGANMFYKRVKRSYKWVHEGPDPSSSDGEQSSIEPSTPDLETAPYIKVSKGPPKLKLILDPRHLQDAIKLRSEGININEHNVISPDICHDLVRDLNSPVGKGAALFAKRKKKSEEWIVDDKKVRAHLQQKQEERPATPLKTVAELPPPATTGIPALNRLQEMICNPRLMLIKSPWEAALSSPIGSCEDAFVEYLPHQTVGLDMVAETVIRAAENKTWQLASEQPSKPRAATPPPQATPPLLNYDLYRPRAPRGWTGTNTGSTFNMSEYAAIPELPATDLSTTQKPLPKFSNFNTLPRSWSPCGRVQGSFRSVRPLTYLK